MRATSKLLALAFTAALQPAMAGTVALNFEDVAAAGALGPGQNGLQAGSRYAGQGVSFTGDAWSVKSKIGACGETQGLLFTTQSPSGGCGALLLAGAAGGQPTGDVKKFTIDVADGFLTGSSFLYGIRSVADVTIEVFSEAAGQGRSLFFTDSFSAGECTNSALLFCNGFWGTQKLEFSGTAKSLVIIGLDQSFMMDNLNFFTPTASNQLPEPTSIALALGALAGAGWTRRRAAR